MARPLRIVRTGGWYHVTGRGNERRAIYRDNRDRQHFCDLLAEMVRRFRVRLHAFVLMDNHYHLIIELTEPNLSQAGQWLNVSYSVWFNHRHDRSGHLFQGRFKSVVVDPIEWGLALSRYVHLNPVRTGRLGLGKIEQQRLRVGASSVPDAIIVKDRISKLRCYRWSSYRAYVGLGKPPDWLEYEGILQLGRGKKDASRRRYREYVEAALREGLAESPWEQLREQVVLGSEEFVEKLRHYVVGDPREQRGVHRLVVARPRLSEVIAKMEAVKGEPWAEFKDRHGDSGRDLVLYMGRRVCGLKLQELAKAAGMADYHAVSMAIRQLEKRLGRGDVEPHLDQVCHLLNIQM